MSGAEQSGELEPRGTDPEDQRVPGTTVVDTVPVADPGIERHIPRWTDVDEAAGNRAERTVVGLFLMAPVLSVIFVIVYYAVPRNATIVLGPNTQYPAQNVLLGVTLGLALICIGAGAVQWARQLMSDHEVAEERHAPASSPADRETFMEKFDAGADDTGLSRRKMIIRTLGLAVGALGLPLIVSLSDLGPWPTREERARTIDITIWAPGVRLVNDITFKPIRPADLTIGQLVNGQPENLTEYHDTQYLIEKAKAPIIIVRMNPNEIVVPETRQDWHVNGILCYSKICTHVGCPISLWEQQTHHLLCPCHQSTFDLGKAGIVVFGPAARPLPQLPITVDDEGYLVARSGFVYDGTDIPLPVGPSFFERDSSRDLTRDEVEN